MSILKLFYFIIIHSQQNFEAECNHSLVRKSLKQVHNVRDPPYQTLICLFNIQYMKFEFIIIIWSFMFFSFTKARRSKMLTKPTLSLNQPLRCIPSICQLPIWLASAELGLHGGGEKYLPILMTAFQISFCTPTILQCLWTCWSSAMASFEHLLLLLFLLLILWRCVCYFIVGRQRWHHFNIYSSSSCLYCGVVC